MLTLIHTYTHTEAEWDKGRAYGGSFCSRRYKYFIRENAAPSLHLWALFRVLWPCSLHTSPLLTQPIYLTQRRTTSSDRQISCVPKVSQSHPCQPVLSVDVVCMWMYTKTPGGLQPSLSETW